MSHRRRRVERTYAPGFTALESRIVPAQFGVPWHDADHLTISFVPDGTLVGTQPSTLFQTLDAQRPASEWQGEILRAFQTWAINAHINFAVKPDNGQPLGVAGPDQADPRFGDIRIGAIPLSPEVLSVSVPHDPFLSGTWSGDILLNSTVAFDDRQHSLFPVLLHEVGHVLGLDHSTDPRSAMFERLDNQRTGLGPTDIAAVQSLYGPREADPFEGPRGNGDLADATAIPTPAGYDGSTPLLIYGDLTTGSDVDVYSFTPPAGAQGPVTVRVQTAGVSLLAPHLTIFDASGAVVGDLASTQDTGDTLETVLPNVAAGQTYSIRIQGARDDVFGIGEYALAVNFDARSTVTTATLDTVVRETYSYLAPEDIAALLRDPQGALFHDDHHTNDTPATAETVYAAGAYGSEAPIRFTASLGDPNDVDVYHFETPDRPAGTAQPTPLVMTVTVRATEVNGIMPRALVRDVAGDIVPALVLAHGDGTYTIQVAGAHFGTDYWVEVRGDPSSGKVVGNYDLDVEFGSNVANPTPFVGGALNDALATTVDALVVNQTQLFDFLLAATATAAVPVPVSGDAPAVVMTLTDAAGHVVATRVTSGGETAGGDPVLLPPGVYLVRFSLQTPNPDLASPLIYRLYGASLTDPIGPALDDPTFAPLTAPGTTPFLPVLASGGDAYTWLALSVAAPAGPRAAAPRGAADQAPAVSPANTVAGVSEGGASTAMLLSPDVPPATGSSGRPQGASILHNNPGRFVVTYGPAPSDRTTRFRRTSRVTAAKPVDGTGLSAETPIAVSPTLFPDPLAAQTVDTSSVDSIVSCDPPQEVAVATSAPAPEPDDSDPWSLKLPPEETTGTGVEADPAPWWLVLGVTAWTLVRTRRLWSGSDRAAFAGVALHGPMVTKA